MPAPMTHRFVFPVHDLANTPKVVDAPLPADYVRALLHDCEPAPFSEEPGHIDVTLSMSGRDVVVHGRIRMAMAMPCARCLKPARFDIDTDISLLLTPGKPQPKTPGVSTREAASDKRAGKKGKVVDKPEKAPGKGRKSHDDDSDGYEFAGDETDVDTYNGDEVVLDPFVREWILLETPIFPLCSEACPGIHPVPVAYQAPVESDPVLDPRLRPLLEIQKKKL